MFRNIIRHQVRLNSTLATTSNIPAHLSPNTVDRVAKVFPTLAEVSQEKLLSSNGLKGKYYVGRTSKGGLPVYWRMIDHAKYTEIKRVQGDLTLLRDDIQKVFPELRQKDFTIHPQSSTVRVRGDLVVELRNILSKVF